MLRHRIAWRLLALSLLAAPAWAGTQEDLSTPQLGKAERPYWRRNLFVRFAADQKFLVTKWWPAEARNYAFGIPVVTATALASGAHEGGLDARLSHSISEWTTRHQADGFARTFTSLGDAKSIAAIGVTYLISRWSGNERGRRVTSLSAEALLDTGLYVTVLKSATRRTRPSAGGDGAFFVSDPAPGQETNSFPSGHAAGAFATATVFAHEFRDKKWVPWVSYGTASLIALSRVQLGRHFVSDVVVGALLGNSMGRMVAHRAEGGDIPFRPGRWEPIFDPDGNGAGVQYHRVW